MVLLKEKFGPFWIAPTDSELNYSHWTVSQCLSKSKNWKCRRFKTKESLLEVISMIRQKELEFEIHRAKLNKTLHIEQEIV